MMGTATAATKRLGRRIRWLLLLGLLPAAPVFAANEQQDCLALAMYWEAKAEGERGMAAVGHVVLNRVAHEAFPASACAVVKQGGETPPCQFSWWCDGKSDRPRELENWREAQRIAQAVSRDRQRRRGKHSRDPTKGALFFHATGMKNPWRIPRTRTVTIGGHVFYTL